MRTSIVGKHPPAQPFRDNDGKLVIWPLGQHSDVFRRLAAASISLEFSGSNGYWNDGCGSSSSALVGNTIAAKKTGQFLLVSSG